MGKKLILLLLTYFLFTNYLFAKKDFYGLWIDQGKNPKYEFIQGFKPNKGIVIIYNNNAIYKIETFTLNANKIEFEYDYETYTVSLKGKILVLKHYDETKTFSRDAKKESLKIVDFKKNNKLFIQNMLSTSWSVPSKTYYFIPGFSNSTGIYHIIIKGETETLASWGSTKDLLKIGSYIYVEGKISQTYMILLDDDDEIFFLRRGKKVKSLEKVEMKLKKEKFVPNMISGTWIQTTSWGKEYFKFRPIFGDLSGLQFQYDSEKKYRTAENWEYSLKTGQLRVGYDKYINAHIKGKYLLLLSDDNEVKSFERPNEKIEQYRYSDLKIVKVSEKNTKDLKKIMERQWYRSDEFYQFVFETSRTGFFHRFQTKPFTITGNKLEIGDKEHEDVKFMDNMLVVGDGEYNTFELDTNIVFLQHISQAKRKLQANQLKKSSKNLNKKNVYINLVLHDGSVKKVDLPIDSLSSIAEITIREGL